MYLIESPQNIILYLVANKKKLILGLVVSLLILGNIVFMAVYLLSYNKVLQLQNELKIQQMNMKTVNFLKTFINKVLKSDKEVSFEDRLKLENNVRDLNDKDILAQWEKFISSKTEQEAQKEIINLLKLLADKIYF